VREAIDLSKKGLSIANDLFTSSEVLALANAQGVELPEVSTFAVCRVSANGREPYKTIASGEVNETTAIYVAEKNLSFSDALNLCNMMNKQLIHENAVTRFTNAVNTAQELLESNKKDLAEAQQLQADFVRQLEEFRQTIVEVAQ